MKEQKRNAPFEAERKINALPGSYYCELPSGDIVAFEKKPRRDIWPRQLSRQNAVLAVAGENGLIPPALALTHDEGYQRMMDDGIKNETQLLMALDLSGEFAWDNLGELLSSLNTETGSAWVVCPEENKYWAEEEEACKVLKRTKEGFIINCN